MNFLAKIFSKKGKPSNSPTAEPSSASPLPSGAPLMIKSWDEQGRVIEIPREEWRTKVLPHNFRTQWNKPDALASLIHTALTDGFFADCLEAAGQLHRIDPQPHRGAILFAATLLQLRKYDEAEKILTASLLKHGEDGLLLANLAKAQNGQGRAGLAEETLWHALELDPNLEFSLSWYGAIHSERGGEEARIECLKRVAALEGSWLAQLHIARTYLNSRRLPEAIELYHDCLSRVSKPAPSDMLQSISGDLGNAGHLPEILHLVAPHFDAALHGLLVGNNLIKAYLDLGHLEAAHDVLEQLHQQNRADWKEHLSFWDLEIAKMRASIQELPTKAPPFTMLTIPGPIWLKPDSPASELFPAKTADGPTVAVICSAVGINSDSDSTGYQTPDAAGRMSRALPLFLAEKIEFESSARVQTLIPWITGKSPAFVVSGTPWDDASASEYGRLTANKNDYIVVSFLIPKPEAWLIELRLVRTIDAMCLATASTSVPAEQPETGIPALGEKLLAILHDHAEVQKLSPPESYQIPGPSWFGSYLLRLEQLLAVRCTGMDGVPTNFLFGEREILDGNLQLCLAYPQNIGVRILFAQTLLAMKRVRTSVVQEYQEKVRRLQTEKPLSEPAQSVLQRLINEAFLLE
jgi:tetratricopeptide (TPR) repeat protein